MTASPDTSGEPWFPRPRTEADVLVVGPVPRGVGSLFAMLHDPAAEEWRDRVGVVGARDGSAKTTTRLLLSGGLVFKTDLARARASSVDALAEQRAARETARELGLAHADKLWLVLAAGGAWLPATACPRLRTLREPMAVGARIARWTEMIAVGAVASREGHVGLDLNPSNFGVDAAGKLYYLDDETYAPSAPEDLGEAAARRIPESGDLKPSDWAAFGRMLVSRLRESGLGRDALVAMIDGASGCALSGTFDAQRDALVAGMRERVRVSRASPRARYCLFADVHANLPALDAVLTDATTHGVDAYLFLGDAVGYGPHPDECVQRIAALPNLVAVCGNHDHACVAEDIDGMGRSASEVARWTRERLSPPSREWLRGLPREHAEPDWWAMHGAPRDPARFLAYVYELTYRENLDVVARSGAYVAFCGHTHVPFVHALDREQRAHKLGAVDWESGPAWPAAVVNPGAVGQSRDGNTRASYAIWDRARRSVSFHRVGYPVERVVRDIRRLGLPDDLATRLELGR